MNTFTIQDIAVALHHKLDIETAAAEAALDTYIEQIEDIDGREIDRDEITEADSDFLMESVRQSQRSGDLGETQLGQLEETMARIRQVEQDRDPQIRAALAAGARVKDVMAATGLSRERIRQIRSTRTTGSSR